MKKETPQLDCGSYKIICLTSKKTYYGMSTNLKKRKQIHFSQLRTGSHPCKEMQADFTKHGERKFKFEIIEKTKDFVDASVSEINHLMIAVNNKEAVYNYLGKDRNGKKYPPTITTRSISFRRENLEALQEYAEISNHSVSWIVNALVKKFLLGELKIEIG